MASPLIISGNIRNISQHVLETYSNTEVIAVDQDPLAKQGFRLWSSGPGLRNNTQQVWARPLNNNAWALLFINAGLQTTDITCDSACMAKMSLPARVNVRDLWAHKDLGSVTTQSYTAKQVLANGGVLMLKLTIA